MGSKSRNFLVQDAGFQVPGLAKLGAGHPKDFEWATRLSRNRAYRSKELCEFRLEAAMPTLEFVLRL